MRQETETKRQGPLAGAVSVGPATLWAILSVTMATALWHSGALFLHSEFQAPLRPLVLRPEVTAEPIAPIPRSLPLDAAKIALGKRLFNDKRLSRDDSVACASCHDLANGGADRRQQSIGIGGQIGKLNAPPVFNSGFNFRQFWDGRAETLEDQVDGPIHSPVEMGSSWPQIVGKLKLDAQYVSQFGAAFSDGIEAANIKGAIAEFERSLTTPDSRFDQYLRGDEEALSRQEKDGYQLFKRRGCIACHQGVNVGGNLYQRLGVIKPFFMDPSSMGAEHLGRMAVTGNPEDRNVFKVPSLRNVALTAPYFHDGSVGSLERAVYIMSEYQLGVPIAPKDVALIVMFLHTLTGNQTGMPQ
jgi:cytochrome c peroxidase